MKLYFAPLEGINGYIYRNVYHTCFNNIDKYFTPFITPKQRGHLSPQEIRDVSPENNKGFYIVPQILTKNAAAFIRTAKDLRELGYDEVNLNLGCPSKTVVTKGKGAGFLAFPEELDRFLEEIFEKCDMKISIKTRIGKDSPDEFPRLLEIYNKYPLEELIIHPRLQLDYYKNTPNWELFAMAVRESKSPLCYNGDIFSKEDYENFRKAFPQTETLMLGRGILRNPGLACWLKYGERPDKERIRDFHDKVYIEYQKILFGDKTVLFKMKELWFYMIELFPDSRKYAKKIKKAEKLYAYEDAVNALFREREICL